MTSLLRATVWPTTHSDAEWLFENIYSSSDEAMRYYHKYGGRWGTAQDVANYIRDVNDRPGRERDGTGSYVIMMGDDRIGEAVAARSSFDRDTAIIGIALIPSARSQGWARQAITDLMRVLAQVPVEHGGVATVRAEVALDNSRSHKLFRSLDFFHIENTDPAVYIFPGIRFRQLAVACPECGQFGMPVARLVTGAYPERNLYCSSCKALIGSALD